MALLSIDFLVLRVWVEPGPRGCLVRLFYLLKRRSTGSFVSRSDYRGQLLEKGGHRPDLRLPRAPRGFPRLLEAPGPGCRLICIRCCYWRRAELKFMGRVAQ